MKKLLVIGGSDPFAGGGIQTDLKTVENHQLFGLSALTCIATVTGEDFQIHPLPELLLAEQLDSLPAQLVDGIKIGLIHNINMIPIIKEFLMENKEIPVVLDPVLAFKETETTYEEEYIDTLKKELFPLASVITPNLKEAELLLGYPVNSLSDMERAAVELSKTGAKGVVVKGGSRVAGETAYDVLYSGGKLEHFSKPKLTRTTVNGAGCSFASALTSNLVLDIPLSAAMECSKSYVFESILMGAAIDDSFGSVWHQGKSVEKQYEFGERV